MDPDDAGGDGAGVSERPGGDRIYVGGFLALYNEQPEEKDLLLPREVVSRHLRARAKAPYRVPININHDEAASIGSLCELFDVENGLFCFGEIYSRRFLDIVSRSCDKSYLVSKGPGNGLKPDPMVEYLTIGYPGLSLSNQAADVCGRAALTADATVASPVLGSGGEPRLRGSVSDVPEDYSFFKHVAICGVGRRRGTLGIYGRDVRWILDKFSALSEHEKACIENAVACCLESPVWDAVTGEEDPFRSDAFGLLANSVDTAYIRERFPKLEYDKKILRQDCETYIRASESPSSAKKKGAACIIKDVVRRQAAGDAPRQPDTDARSSDMAQPAAAAGAPTAQIAVPAAPLPTLSSDCVYLSKDAFLSLLNVNRPSSAPSQPATVAQTPLPALAASYVAPNCYGAPSSVSAFPADMQYQMYAAGRHPSHFCAPQQPLQQHSLPAPHHHPHRGLPPLPSPPTQGPGSYPGDGYGTELSGRCGRTSPPAFTNMGAYAAGSYSEAPKDGRFYAPHMQRQHHSSQYSYENPNYRGHVPDIYDFRDDYENGRQAKAPAPGRSYGRDEREDRMEVVSSDRRRRNRSAAAATGPVSGSADERDGDDLSFPGDADYERRSSKRARRDDDRERQRSKSAPSGHEMSYEDLCDAIADLKKDLALARTAAAQTPVPTETVPSPQNPPADAAAAAAAAAQASRPEPSPAEPVARIAEETPRKNAQIAQPERPGASGVTKTRDVGRQLASAVHCAPPPIVVNASCEPQDAVASRACGSSTKLLDINRRMFVAALNEMDS